MKEGAQVSTVVIVERNGIRRLRSVDPHHVIFAEQEGRGDKAKHGGSGLDSREPKHPIIQPRDMYTPDLHIDTLKVKVRNFR